MKLDNTRDAHDGIKPIVEDDVSSMTSSSSVSTDLNSFPAPPFEGSEKRLEVDFAAICSAEDPNRLSGMRALNRDQLDRICHLARCCIVSSHRMEHFDAYVLSESSMFVYPHRFVLKTCGTTTLLHALEEILSAAKYVGLVPCRVKFTRACFQFPANQPFPHDSFENESIFLKNILKNVSLERFKAFQLGDSLKWPRWHVFVATNDNLPMGAPLTLECCMTGIRKDKAASFFRDENFTSADNVTTQTGIRDLLPNSFIDDYVFEPCGYSMNGIEGQTFSTIHVTPEDGFSYASFEVCAYDESSYDLKSAIEKVARIFEPERLSLALTIPREAESTLQGDVCPNGYLADLTISQFLPDNSYVTFLTFDRNEVKSISLSPESVDYFYEKDVDADIESECSFDMDDEDSNEAVSVIESAVCVKHVEKTTTYTVAMNRAAKSFVLENSLDEAFYIVDLAKLVEKYQMWRKYLPTVKPFYAVKANSDPMLIKVLARLGLGFDCASPFEVDAVLRTGLVRPDQIVYANPCKLKSHMKSVSVSGVSKSTFDSVDEIEKCAKHWPSAELLMRIRIDDPGARCPLGKKYGAELSEIEGLLCAVKKSGVPMVGVSFHVGSGAKNPTYFAQGIQQASRIFALAKKILGYELYILDIGGGFSGNDAKNFKLTASVINSSLHRNFKDHDVMVIAEPGRFFCEEAATLVTNVFGRRKRGDRFDYWIGDGVYGSMNCLLYDHASLTCRPLIMGENSAGFADDNSSDEEEAKDLSTPRAEHESTIFGPTCDSFDMVLENIILPELNRGDWLIFPNMGAYTHVAASSFNGFSPNTPKTFYVFCK